MSLLKRMAYLGIGAFLALAVVLGAAVTLAQSDDDTVPPEAQEDDATDDGSAVPDFSPRGFRDRGDLMGGPIAEDAYLAAALGISSEELEAAEASAWAAALAQAVDEGLITQEQADQLLDGGARFHGRFIFGSDDSIDHEALLADALGISVDELQTARADARLAKLDAMVEAGVLTQEEADLMAARESVQGYVDQAGVAAALQDAYEAAIDAALADDAITQEQADLLLDNAPDFSQFGFPGLGGPGRGRGHGHHGFPGGPGAGTNFFQNDVPAANGA